MPDTTCHMSISLDGFVAGPDQSREDPLGKRGREIRRAELGDARFHLLLPAIPRGLHRLIDPEVTGRAEAHERLRAALPHLSVAAGTEVTGEVGDADPMAALHDALYRRPFDEIIVSTLPRRVSRWLRLDLPSKARGLGLPVTLIEAQGVLSPAEPSAVGATVA